MASAAPPSYEAVLDDIKAKIEANPKDVYHVANVLAAVPEKDKQTILSNASANTTLPNDQLTQIGTGMSDLFHTAQGQAFIEDRAQQATKAIKGIDESFSALTGKLSTIDTSYPKEQLPDGAFVPKILALQKEFHGIVDDSRKLASDVGFNAKIFADEILPLIDDKNKTPAQKIERVEDFLKESSGFEQASGKINTRYTTLVANMTVFTGTFGGWAKKREGEIDARVIVLNQEIKKIDQDILDKQKVILGTGIAAGVMLPVTGVIAILSGPFAPAVMIVGALATLGLTLTAVAFAFQVTSLRNIRSGKNDEIKRLTDEKDGIKKTRDEIVTLGNAELAKFKTNVDVLAGFWTSATVDAGTLNKYFKNIEKKIDKDWHDEAIKSARTSIDLYNHLAKYMDDYAKGVDNSK